MYLPGSGFGLSVCRLAAWAGVASRFHARAESRFAKGEESPRKRGGPGRGETGGA